MVQRGPVVANRLKRILGLLAPGRRVVLVSTREEAHAMLNAPPFDLVFVDMQLYPTGQGAALVADVRARLLRANVIAPSDTDDRESVLRTFASGTTGYPLSNVEDADIAFALHTLTTGTVLNPRVARHLLAALAETLAAPDRAAAGLCRERDFGARRKLARGSRTLPAPEETCRGLPD